MVKFNFIYAHKESTVPIFTELKNVQQHYVYVSNVELHRSWTIDVANYFKPLSNLSFMARIFIKLANV
jgi:hypothetical protein